MRFLRKICAVSAAALLMLSCGKQGRVIPAHKLAKIYAEMLLADQQLRNHPELTMAADTSLFYEPILAGYGYSGKDYVRSVGHYMEDPESFGKIFKETKDILDRRISELRAAELAVRRADSLRMVISSMDFLRAPVYFGEQNDTVRLDTVHVSIDSLGIYSWERVVPDTLYDGPVFRLKAASDTLSASLGTVMDTVRVEGVKADDALGKKLQIKEAAQLKPGVMKATMLLDNEITRR